MSLASLWSDDVMLPRAGLLFGVVVGVGPARAGPGPLPRQRSALAQ